MANSKGDTCFYGEWDEKSGAFCVFGDNSGFAYCSFASEAEAFAKTIEMNKEMALLTIDATIRAIPQQRQVQYSLNDQLYGLVVAATKIGIQDGTPDEPVTDEVLLATVAKIPQLPPVKFDHAQQKRILQVLATKLGLYDAADYCRADDRR